MPPQLVLLIGYCLVLWLLRRDMKARQAGSWALLIPGLCIAMQGSRPLSFWLGGGEGEGSLIDTAVDVGLIAGSVIVLQKRGLDWGRLIGRNKALFLIYSYFVLSAVWSDIPLLSLKRIVKDFGLVLIALVLLTERNPMEAIRAVFVRVSYVLFPLSVVAIKWFPEIGRQPRNSGDAMFRGLTPHKNMLGVVVFVFGLMLLWDLIEIWNWKDRTQKKRQIQIRIGMLLIGAWLLVTCDSQTSLLCMTMGVFIFWAAGRLLQMRQGKQVLIACLACGIGLAVADKTFGLSEIVIKALGRNPTLTGRTEIWQIVKQQGTDPLIGNGFYIFWDTSRGQNVVDGFMRIKSTHNGYLEVYVDGGLLGDILLALLLLVLGGRVINRLFMGSPLGKMGLVFWILAIIYNLSESSFFRLDALWFVLLLVTIECPRRSPRSAQVAVGEGAATSPA